LELVYLWVEDYKNIHEEGFNFSPKFNCHYDGETLTINENIDEEGNKQYIENFFGDNINVTAIVGKNGSGKSSIIKFIRLLLKHFSGEYIKTSIWMILFYDSIQDEFYCLAHEDLDSLSIEGKYVKKTIIYVYNTSIDQNKFQNIPFLEKAIFPLLDYSLSYDNPISLRNLHNRPQSNRFLDFPNKSERNIYLYDEHIETMRKVFQNFKELNQRNHWKIFEDFFYPQYLSISFNMESFKVLGLGVDNNKAVSKYIKERKKIDIEFIHLFYSRLQDHFNLKLSQLERFRILKRFTNKTYFNTFDDLCKKNNLKINKKENRKNEYNIFEFEISNILEDEIDYLLELSLSEIFTIDIIDKNGKNFNELSFGEQQLLKILNIIYHLSTNKEHEKLLIFLDEIDIGFHPNWQKKVIQYILKLTTILSTKKFHLLISSHSPFLLSDLPKQNIIFLDTYKEKDKKVENREQKIGNCKVLSHDKVLLKQQTFGANIHTLLTDSFFMEGGLMGEFAKQKINKIIRFLNGKNRFIDFPINQIEKVINSIGEPFLKQKLLDMYNKKFIKEYKDRQKEKIKKQIEDLNSQLRELDNDSNK